MSNCSTFRRAGFVLLPLLVGACSWPQPPAINTQEVRTSSARQESVELPDEASSIPPANAPQLSTDQGAGDEAARQKAISSECNAAKPGQVIGFDEFLAATLIGSEGERLYISSAPGAAPGESYGLVGDEVEAIATALDNKCIAWTWVKWPESDYRGWLPAAAVNYQR